MWAGESEVGGVRLCALWSECDGLAVGGHLLALLCVERVDECHLGGLQGTVVQFYLDGHIGRTFRHILLGDVHAGRGTVGHADVALLCHDEPYRAVDAAVHAKEGVVDGYHIGARLVVGLDHNLVVGSYLQRRTYLYGEGRVASFVGTYQLVVDIYIGAGSHALEAQKYALVAQAFGAMVGLAVIARSGIEVIVLGLHVGGIPRMWYLHRFPLVAPRGHSFYRLRGYRAFLKFPSFTEGDYLPRVCLCGKSRQCHGGANQM